LFEWRALGGEVEEKSGRLEEVIAVAWMSVDVCGCLWMAASEKWLKPQSVDPVLL